MSKSNNQTIWKYPLKLTDRQNVPMPLRSKILTAQWQESTDAICLWALVNENVALTRRMVHVYGTGQPLPKNPGEFISTVQMGSYAWHIFDGGEE